MKVNYREADVKKLRSNVLQAFLKMIVKDGWRQNLIDKANQMEKANNDYKKPYVAARNTMREIGEENYSIDKMDVTLISGILCYCPQIATIEQGTRTALRALRDDRNITGHSHNNEEEEELYLRYILDLYDLKRFVRAVDQNEKSIADDKRLEFLRKYVKKINDLIDLLDEERIELVKNHKEIDKHIQEILSSENPYREYARFYLFYADKAKIEHNRVILHEFDFRASDAGIRQADSGAIDYCIDIKDYEMAEKRILSTYIPSDKIDAHEVRSCVWKIDYLYSRAGKISDDLRKLVKDFQHRGFEIKDNEDGSYDYYPRLW